MLNKRYETNSNNNSNINTLHMYAGKTKTKTLLHVPTTLDVVRAGADRVSGVLVVRRNHLVVGVRGVVAQHARVLVHLAVLLRDLEGVLGRARHKEKLTRGGV